MVSQTTNTFRHSWTCWQPVVGLIQLPMVTPSRVIPPNLIQNVASISASSLRLTFEPSFRVSGIKVVNFIESPLGRLCGQSDNGQHDSTGASLCRPVRRSGTP